MKKAFILIPIIVAILFAAHIYQNREVIDPVLDNTAITESMEKKMANEAETEPEVVENIDLLKFKIDKPSVAIYKVQKRFLNKEDEEVLGETESIKGIADFDLSTNELSLFAEVDLTKLRSDNSKRDEDVLKLFSPQSVKVTYNGQLEKEVFLGEEGVDQQPLTMTINGIEKDVLFDVTYFVTPTSANVKGKATIKMSDFEIEPPSILGIYTVDDEMELFFDINLNKN